MESRSFLLREEIAGSSFIYSRFPLFHIMKGESSVTSQRSAELYYYTLLRYTVVYLTFFTD